MMIRSQLTNLSVEPYQRVSTRTISSIYIIIESLELFKSVTVRITYMDTANAYVDSEMITIDGQDYSDWGNDDTFLYRYISTKKGFTIIQPGTIPVTPAVVEPVDVETTGLGDGTIGLGEGTAGFGDGTIGLGEGTAILGEEIHAVIEPVVV